MAEVKISQLPQASLPLTGTEVFPLVQSGTTVQAAVNSVAAKTNTISTLRGLDPANYSSIYVTGYNTANDGGGGEFYSSTGFLPGHFVDNGGTIIVPTGGDGSSAWLRVTSGAYSVRWFGAKGDGLTNDYTAIQSCINAAAAIAGAVYVPAGTYICGTGLLGASNMDIYGDGQDTSILKTRASTDIRLLAFAAKTNFSIRNLGFDGNKANNPSTHADTVYIDTCDHFYINNCTFIYGAGYGLTITGSNTPDAFCIFGLISECMFREQTYGGLKLFSPFQYIVIADSYFLSNGLAGIAMFWNGVAGSGQDTQSRIDNCIIEANAGQGVYAYALNQFQITNCQINLNGITTPPNDGVYLADSWGITIENNMIYTNGKNGIYAFNSPGLMVTGNRINHNGRGINYPTVSAQYSGIHLEAGVSLVTSTALDTGQYIITNNELIDAETPLFSPPTPQPPVYQKYGYYQTISDAGAGIYGVIFKNNTAIQATPYIYPGNADATYDFYFDLTTGTTSDMLIYDNQGRTNLLSQNGGTATFNGTGAQTDFVINHGLYTTPTKISVTPESADAAALFRVSATSSTTITVKFTVAPVLGTGNVVLLWTAKV